MINLFLEVVELIFWVLVVDILVGRRLVLKVRLLRRIYFIIGIVIGKYSVGE